MTYNDVMKNIDKEMTSFISYAETAKKNGNGTEEIEDTMLLMTMMFKFFSKADEKSFTKVINNHPVSIKYYCSGNGRLLSMFANMLSFNLFGADEYSSPIDSLDAFLTASEDSNVVSSNGNYLMRGEIADDSDFVNAVKIAEFVRANQNN